MECDYVIGIDGGGTRSRGVVLALDGTELASADGGGLNFYTTSQGLFARHLNQVLEALQGEMGESRCLKTVIGTAALFDCATPLEQSMALEGVKVDSLGDISLVGDAVTAVSGAGGGRETILVISGTGSIAVRLLSGGEAVFSGGLGPMLGGDPGSAFWMASRALEAVQRQFCRDRALGALGKLLCDYFGTTDIMGIVSYVHQVDDGRSRLASAAKMLAESRHFDVTKEWQVIERDAGMALAGLISPLIDGYGNEGEKIYISGSVLTLNEWVRQSLAAALNVTHGREFTLATPRHDAAVGAGLMALRSGPSLMEGCE